MSQVIDMKACQEFLHETLDLIQKEDLIEMNYVRSLHDGIHRAVNGLFCFFSAPLRLT